MRQIYFDSGSATPVLPEALEAMAPYFSEDFGSASSLHQRGLEAREAIASAREETALLIGAESPDNIIFTSDGTESSNLAIKGAAWANHRRGNHIVVGAAEHPGILNSVEFLTNHGFECTKIGTNAEGLIDPAAVEAAITSNTILIAVQHANQDVGAIQPIQKISQIAGERGIALYVDAEASAGWLPINVADLGATLLSFSPHRFYGPKGIGVLYRQRAARLTPLLHGGDQENGYRAGVENTPAIVGAGVAARIAKREGAQRTALAGALQQRFWNGLKSSVSRVALNGPEPGALRTPTNLNVSFEGIEGEGLALLCDMNGIAVGAGTACVSKSLRVSPTFRAMGWDAARAQGSVIFSFGKDNTADEVDYVLSRLPKLVAQLRDVSPVWDATNKNTP